MNNFCLIEKILSNNIGCRYAEYREINFVSFGGGIALAIPMACPMKRWKRVA
jgi:hypothetical protein